MAAKKEVKFEENIKELENIINTLEGGEVSLDEMLNLFEEGIKRTKECTKQLKEAEQKEEASENAPEIMEEELSPVTENEDEAPEEEQ